MTGKLTACVGTLVDGDEQHTPRTGWASCGNITVGMGFTSVLLTVGVPVTIERGETQVNHNASATYSVKRRKLTS